MFPFKDSILEVEDIKSLHHGGSLRAPGSATAVNEDRFFFVHCFDVCLEVTVQVYVYRSFNMALIEFPWCPDIDDRHIIVLEEFRCLSC